MFRVPIPLVRKYKWMMILNLQFRSDRIQIEYYRPDQYDNICKQRLKEEKRDETKRLEITRNNVLENQTWNTKKMDARHQISKAVMPGAKKLIPKRVFLTKYFLNDICEKKSKASMKVEKKVAARWSKKDETWMKDATDPPTIWSLLFIFVFLCWSSRIQRNIV